jgi:hypothetical protein
LVRASAGILPAPETVRRMVEFLYTGDYDAVPGQSEPANPTGSSKLANLFHLLSEGPSAALRYENDAPDSSSHSILSPATGGGDGVLQHVRVSVIADYYDIQGLAKLANSKIQSNSVESWDTQALADALKDSSDLTRDGDLQETMAALAVQNINNLLDTTVIHAVVGDFGLKIIRNFAQKTEALENELREKTNLLVLGAGREEIARDTALRTAARTARANENISRCIETLRERDCCRNNKCYAEFNCYIEERGHQPVYTLRCTKCRCRH